MIAPYDLADELRQHAAWSDSAPPCWAALQALIRVAANHIERAEAKRARVSIKLSYVLAREDAR